LAAPDPDFVYLDAYYPRTSLGFLIPSLILFAGLTAGFVFWAGRAFWPLAAIFALVTLYLATVTARQVRGIALAVRVTDRGVYHAGWEPGLFRKGLPGGLIPLDAIGGVEVVSLRSAAGAGPVVALWLSDPQHYRRGVGQLARQMSGAGDLAIPCDETDRTAEQVRDAIEVALANHISAQFPQNSRN
jgi:hypothetical protein